MDDYVVYKPNFAESFTDNGLKPSFLTAAVSITQWAIQTLCSEGAVNYCVFVLVSVTTMYKGRCGTSGFISHTASIFGLLFTSALRQALANICWGYIQVKMGISGRLIKCRAIWMVIILKSQLRFLLDCYIWYHYWLCLDPGSFKVRADLFWTTLKKQFVICVCVYIYIYKIKKKTIWFMCVKNVGLPKYIHCSPDLI